MTSGMRTIDLAALPPTAAELDAERRRLTSTLRRHLALTGSLLALLSLAIGLNATTFGYGAIAGIVLMVLGLLYAGHTLLHCALALDSLRPATESQCLLVSDALQFLAVARYMTYVQAQSRPLTGREAATIIVYALREHRRAEAARRNENEYGL
ncbi:hypothetical protein WJ96_05785 [Burkholderia ubonensis]|uniref:Uncharacterized protein n=2 Tax=Burkholderia ubonensis TaxID=101571 RepID=A0AAW3MWB8_9BURK|nr:hypothetical protein WJ96_05785 [Burkholderia ubonensis]KVZ92777.1 hypothetical protein WL25_17445 [Burkholderia ubonensis]